MSLAEQIKPISYLKANAAEVVKNLRDGGEPLYITQNGEAKLVVQDVRRYEETQETLALLKILALGDAELAGAKVVSSEEAFAAARARLTR